MHSDDFPIQIWQDYDAEAERAIEELQKQSDDTQPLKTEYMDVIISDVRTKSGLSFSVQILNTEGKSDRPIMN